MQKFRFRYRIFKIRFRSSPNPCKSLYIFALLICYVYFECTNRFLTKIYWISNYQNNQKIKWPKLKITEGTHQKRATIPRKIKNKNFKKKIKNKTKTKMFGNVIELLTKTLHWRRLWKSWDVQSEAKPSRNRGQRKKWGKCAHFYRHQIVKWYNLGQISLRLFSLENHISDQKYIAKVIKWEK